MAKKSILFIQTAFLGDLLLSTPALRQIRRRWPDHALHLVCREGLGSIMLKLELVDSFHEVKKSQRTSYQKVIHDFQHEHFDWIFCPHLSWRSAWLVRSLNANHKVGFRQWWNRLFFDERIRKSSNLPEALRQLELLSQQDKVLAEQLKIYEQKNPPGIMAEVPPWASMDLHGAISPSSDPRLLVLPKTVAVFPGSVWPTKQWTVRGFVDLIQRLGERNFSVVLLGGKTEVELARQIQEQTAGPKGKINSLVGQTSLQETLQVLRQCQLVVSNDSGGQHLAAIAGVPTVSIFGPTVLSLGFRPWNPRSQVVQIEGLGCRPCGKHGHVKCPIGTHECMTKIDANQVWQAMEKLGLNP